MLSCILPAHDEAVLIGATLRALADATGTLDVSCEAIVVADACSDDTALLAARHGARVLTVDHRHIAATRNAGARAALGEWLLFVDADTRVDAAVVQAAAAALRAGAVGGGAAVRLDAQAARREHWAAACFSWLFRGTGIAPGCFLFCTRAAFEAVGGFNERYYAGEDVAMSRALAGQGRFVILREPVVTSARKLRTFSAAEHLRLLLRFAWRGRGMLESRRELELWYGRRRDDSR